MLQLRRHFRLQLKNDSGKLARKSKKVLWGRVSDPPFFFARAKKGIVLRQKGFTEVKRGLLPQLKEALWLNLQAPGLAAAFRID
jgi:hypothetical protein